MALTEEETKCPECGSGNRDVRRKRGSESDTLPGWYTQFATGPECANTWHQETKR
jgi:DNA-directed RNA polymerase subunit M/transcription elongation factor TFIIS